jgi:hypothetical protein
VTGPPDSETNQAVVAELRRVWDALNSSANEFGSSNFAEKDASASRASREGPQASSLRNGPMQIANVQQEQQRAARRNKRA